MSHVHDAVIVGAGFGGMGAAIQLRRMGYDDLLILEREDDLGGTWHVEHFGGDVVHTTRWDDDVELEGKRIGIIGTGATAVQLIPKLAKAAGHLTVYQRTPIYVSPKVDGKVPGPVRRAFAKVPLTQRATRLVGASILEVMMVAGVLHYKNLPWANAVGKAVCERHLRSQIKDPELRAKLTPDYDFGCKRPTFSNTYYPTFTKPHVDLETTSIDHVDGAGIVTKDGRRVDLDVLVLATGFNLWDANFPAIQVIGRDDRDLGKWWRDNRFCAYEGITVPKFPNLLSLNSPYSYSGLSYFTTIETQMAHMERLFTAMKTKDVDVFEVREEANDAFLDRMTELLGNSYGTRLRAASAI